MAEDRVDNVEEDDHDQDAINRPDNRPWEAVPLVEKVDDRAHKHDASHYQQADHDGVFNGDDHPRDHRVRSDVGLPRYRGPIRHRVRLLPSRSGHCPGNGRPAGANKRQSWADSGAC